MFEIVNEKVLSSQIVDVCWSHLMDIVAILNKNNELEFLRISYKIQRIFQPIIEKDLIIGMTFSSDSQTFIYFCQNGKINYVKVETGEIFYHIQFKDIYMNAKSIWTNLTNIKDMNIILAISEQSERLIQKIVPQTYMNKNSLQKLENLNKKQNSFEQMINVVNNKVQIIIQNFEFALIEIDLNSSLQETLKYAYFSKDYKHFYIISQDQYNLVKIYNYDSMIWHEELQNICSLSHYYSLLLEYLGCLDQTYIQMKKEVSQVQKYYQLKLETFISDSMEEPEVIFETLRQKFLTFLKFGQIDSDLEKQITQIRLFLSKDQLNDNKALIKIYEKINQHINNLISYVLDNFQNIIEILILISHQIIGHTSFPSLGVVSSEFKSFQANLSDLHIQTQNYLLTVISTKHSFNGFLVWLNHTVIKLNNHEPNIENTKFPLTSQPHLPTVIEFLSSDTFLLKPLSYCHILAPQQICSKNSQRQSQNIQKREQDTRKNKPLLTSLIQPPTFIHVPSQYQANQETIQTLLEKIKNHFQNSFKKEKSLRLLDIQEKKAQVLCEYQSQLYGYLEGKLWDNENTEKVPYFQEMIASKQGVIGREGGRLWIGQELKSEIEGEVEMLRMSGKGLVSVVVGKNKLVILESDQ